ncbi:uncharacterized protein EDB91DRAFT_1349084 [Suillus paluster]|uniref:uncharacterized protein n=1 Tax=Suillus paluster TaxID=48578 RepID=UPI001B87FDC4|nr:uncharacterized protein EDB91DRAFT_1349084 [Suillus paluster]KAG1732434.1 hypothetical protein EDB91DRAFT_1349084 [Suillus paluster]
MSDYWSEDGQQKLALELASWDHISLLQTPDFSDQLSAPAELNYAVDPITGMRRSPRKHRDQHQHSQNYTLPPISSLLTTSTPGGYLEDLYANFSPSPIHASAVSGDTTPLPSNSPATTLPTGPSPTEAIVSSVEKPPSKAPRRAQAKKPKSDTNKKKTRTKGAGSKSGPAGRRDHGGSDSEIAKLSPEAIKDSKIKTPVKSESIRGLTDDNKVKVVEYVTSPERWPSFKVNQAHYWNNISGNLLKGRVTSEQVRNFWHGQAWEKYKAVREREEHTGGGDGDEDGSDAECKPLSAKKRKRGSGEFSAKVLDEFAKSKIYQLIDAVARNDESVIRHREYHSATPLSDEDASPMKKRIKRSESYDGDTSQLLQQVIGRIEERDKRQAQLDANNIELAQKKDKRDEEERAEHCEAAARQAECERQDAFDKQWDRCMLMVGNTNPRVHAYGEKLLDELMGERSNMM